ncbi:hypothetical protein NQ318_015083 [Aromia moschata]|uniref:Gustatory receptor n=1 Tax=Aromia moschata TaxID=1265417 RepID=A0AAV8YZ14_9CUCU|nr:hypothetical protein NQ318_015083 [Aromia moschata]
MSIYEVCKLSNKTGNVAPDLTTLRRRDLEGRRSSKIRVLDVQTQWDNVPNATRHTHNPPIFLCRMFVPDLTISQEHFELLQPILLISRLFGLLPIRYRKHGTQYKLQWSSAYGAYSYLLSIILTVVTLIGVVNDLQKDETHSIRMKEKKGRYVTCCDIIIVIVIVVFSAASLPLQAEKSLEVAAVDAIIPLKDSERYRKRSVYFLAVIFLIFLVVLSFDMNVWAHSTSKTHNTAHFFQNYGSFYLLYCILVTQELFFWHVVFFVKIRISMLNRTLANMEGESADQFYKKVFVRSQVNPRTDSLKLDGKSRCFETNGIEKISIASYQGIFASTARRVISLIKYQEKLSAAVASVNSSVAYGIPVTAISPKLYSSADNDFSLQLIMLSCLMHLIVTPYFLLMEIMKSGNVIFIALQSVWLLIHIGRVLIIVEPCQLCINEHQKTSVIVYELLTGQFDEDEKKALTTFAMQLSYCKMKFTSGGFFKIDRALLTSFNN